MLTTDLLGSPERRDELGRLGRERAADYDWKLIADADWTRLGPHLAR